MHGKGIIVCFAKHTLSKHNLGRLGLRPRPGPLFFFNFFYWAGSGLAWSLAQASDLVGQ